MASLALVSGERFAIFLTKYLYDLLLEVPLTGVLFLLALGSSFGGWICIFGGASGLTAFDINESWDLILSFCDSGTHPVLSLT